MNRQFDKTEGTNRDALAVLYLSVIFGFDRITIWIDRPGLPFLLSKIKKHCTAAEAYLEQMHHQPRWKLRLDEAATRRKTTSRPHELFCTHISLYRGDDFAIFREDRPA